MNNTMVAKIIIVVVDGHDEYISILIRLSSSYLFSIFGIFGLYLPEYYSFLKKLLLSLCSRIIENWLQMTLFCSCSRWWLMMML
jgi:hypothetical protein